MIGLLLASMIACQVDEHALDGPSIEFSAGVFELVGHKEGTPYHGQAMISKSCPHIMHRCVNGVYSKGVVSKSSFWLPADPAVHAIQYKEDGGGDTIKYRVFIDLGNYSLPVGYYQNIRGSEHLLFQEKDEFRCNELCIPMDSEMRYQRDKEPCSK